VKDRSNQKSCNQVDTLVLHRGAALAVSKNRPRMNTFFPNFVNPANKDSVSKVMRQAVGGQSKQVAVPVSHQALRYGLRKTTAEPSTEKSRPTTVPTSIANTRVHQHTKDVENGHGCDGQEAGIADESVPAALAPTCVDCDTSFGNCDQAKYCLTCGASRVENRLFDQLFEVFAPARTTLRKSDLPKFHRHVQDMLQKLVHGKKKSVRRQMQDTDFAFSETLKHQIESGSRFTQGITKEFFQTFLQLVAKSLDLTCRSLLYGLLGQERSNTRGAEEAHSKTEIQRTTRHPDRAGAVCAHCGCQFISNAKFCRNCGQKQPEREKADPNSFHVFQGTRDWRLGRSRVEETIDERDFVELVRLSHAHHVPLGVVRKCWKDFQDFDVNKDGVLQRDEFTEAVRDHCNIPRDVEVPNALLQDHWFKETPQNGEYVDFEAFLLWSFGTEYIEELIVPDLHERHLRCLARKYNVLPNEVDDVKKIFDQYDVRGRGVIEEDEFMRAVVHLVHAQQPEDLGQSTLKRFWREVNVESEGGISFDAFLGWFLRSMPEDK